MRSFPGRLGPGLAALAGALLLAGAPALAAGANLVANGSFESPVVPNGYAEFFSAPSTSLTGWSLTAGSVDLNTGNVWQAADGSQSVDLTGYQDQPGTLSQNVTTTPGESYLLQFAMSGNPLCGFERVQMSVSWGGTQVAAPTFDTSVISLAHTYPVPDMDYVTHQYVVHATQTSTALAFASLTDSSCGPVLDAVSVTDAYTAVCQLVQADSAKPGVATSLCAKLSAAEADALRGNLNAKSGVLGAFANELSAQSGKAFTAAQAAQIEALAAQL